MAGKKNKSVVAVISGLTDSQAARISADIMKSKQTFLYLEAEKATDQKFGSKSRLKTLKIE